MVCFSVLLQVMSVFLWLSTSTCVCLSAREASYRTVRISLSLPLQVVSVFLWLSTLPWVCLSAREASNRTVKVRLSVALQCVSVALPYSECLSAHTSRDDFCWYVTVGCICSSNGDDLSVWMFMLLFLCKSGLSLVPALQPYCDSPLWCIVTWLPGQSVQLYHIYQSSAIPLHIHLYSVVSSASPLHIHLYCTVLYYICQPFHFTSIFIVLYSIHQSSAIPLHIHLYCTVQYSSVISHSTSHPSLLYCTVLHSSAIPLHIPALM